MPCVEDLTLGIQTLPIAICMKEFTWSSTRVQALHCGQVYLDSSGCGPGALVLPVLGRAAPWSVSELQQAAGGTWLSGLGCLGA